MTSFPPRRGRLRRSAMLTAAVMVSVFAAPPGQGVAGAHTDADVVGVAAGEPVTVNLRPNHGCGDSPTIEVAILAPLEDATAEQVDGWSATSEPYGEGQTVLEWTGGVLPTDATGAFPVTFIAPDAVGELLIFPAVQVCENGDELPWIDGDPESDYPAPRLLILPPGSAPAAAIDDVAAGTPGRELLTAVVDPTPSPTSSTTDATSPPASDESSETTTPTPTSAGPGASDESSDSSALPMLPVLGVAAVIMAGAGFLVWKRR